MLQFLPLPLSAGFLVLLFCLGRQISRRRSRSLPYPPGPRPLPLLGNILDIPKCRDFEVYTEWAKKYGDVIHITALGQHIIILNSMEAINDLLDNRSYKYSSRPYSPMMHDADLINAGSILPFMMYGDVWKRYRKLFVSYLGPQAIPAFHEKLHSAAHVLLRFFLDSRSPHEIDTQVNYLVSDIITKLTYGYDLCGKDDPLIDIVKTGPREAVEALNPSRFFINIFPWLKYLPSWLPGSSFRQFALKVRQTILNIKEIPFYEMKRRLKTGTAAPSFASNALTDLRLDSDSYQQQEDDIMEVASAMFGAGVETTSSLLCACIVALIMHPEVQERAQKELDSVLGSPDSPSFRLPTLEDRPHLPYIDAILKEVVRWWQPVPTALPHTTTEADEYRGWHIPKGAIVLGNAWAVLHDEKLYAEPWKFQPERFLSKTVDGRDLPDPMSSGFFGFGRRICPGRPLVEASVWIQIACLMAAFHISPIKIGNDELPVNVTLKPGSDFVLHPEIPRCTVKPKSGIVVSRILEATAF